MAALAPFCAFAQNYPTKPIRMIVPFTPGGAQDVMGRLMGAKLSEATGQQVIIDNRPGAGGVIGMELTARAAPDGYTLGLVAFGTLAINPTLYPKLPYDAFKSFTPVTLYAKVPNLLTVGNSVPARSVKELIALAKAKPGSLTYGSGGQGSGIHLTTESFRLMAKRRSGTASLHPPACPSLCSPRCTRSLRALYRRRTCRSALHSIHPKPSATSPTNSAPSSNSRSTAGRRW